jgi:hypothetical protein
MDASLEGKRGMPFRMVVEEGKIAEFARAVHSSHPEHFQQEDSIVPPTFFMAAAHWQPPESTAIRGVDIDRNRVLHGEQEFVFHTEPPRAGAVLTGQQRIDRVFQKQGKRGGTMTFFCLVTDFTDESGRLVAESRTTILETGSDVQ